MRRELSRIYEIKTRRIHIKVKCAWSLLAYPEPSVPPQHIYKLYCVQARYRKRADAGSEQTKANCSLLLFHEQQRNGPRFNV